MHRLMLICFVIMLILHPHFSQAAPTKQVIGDGTPASCTEEALWTAIETSGSITFNCGANPHTINLSFHLSIEQNRTISMDGADNITLSGGNQTRIFMIEPSSSLTLRNITIRDGNEPQVSGIWNEGTLLMEDVVFTNNIEGIMAFGNSGNATIRRSHFSANHNGSAGVILNDGILLIEDSSFANNTSDSPAHGGAVYNNIAGHTQIHNTEFFSNSATLDGSGGAVFNTGHMTMTRSLFHHNSADSDGGAVANTGHIHITESTFNHNKALNNGGAVYHANQTAPASAVIERTAIYSNTAESWGGGIALNSQTNQVTLAVRNSTISNNTAWRGGGISMEHGVINLINVTVATNTATLTDGADSLMNSLGNITLINTLVTGGAPNCEGTITNSSGNLQFPGTSCGENIPSSDPLLGTLQDNGGITLSHALGPESPGHGTANNEWCPPTDQRGVLRPMNTLCDIGAFEWGAKPNLDTISPDTVLEDSPSITLTVTGSNFIEGTKGTRVRWDDTILTTTYVSPTQLLAVVPAELLVAPYTAAVKVETPTADGETSDNHLFVVRAQTKMYLPMLKK